MDNNTLLYPAPASAPVPAPAPAPAPVPALSPDLALDSGCLQTSSHTDPTINVEREDWQYEAAQAIYGQNRPVSSISNASSRNVSTILDESEEVSTDEELEVLNDQVSLFSREASDVSSQRPR